MCGKLTTLSLIHIWYRKNHRKYDGQIFLFYVLWYGAGRACVEGLRTCLLYTSRCV